ncbi:putative Muts homolog [Klebsormidium nitens]|uniref:Putative Muts homolog n=1 Tax=Klebsormidium nitens TaxID=105231 RepID=A0A1Y1I171_KLENI|nr:putative Muts homolog [Klebsormidium nitens]|eukprot:GAQ83702.1 putative Muts homolog [Klebsormidium nitens]
MLEWDRICSTVATFASTSSGQQLAGVLLLPDTQEGSEALLGETAAALTLDASASGDCLDFGRIGTKAADYGLYKARKGVPMSGRELRLTAAVLSASDRLLRGVTSAIRLEERDLALRRAPSGWGDFSEPPPPPAPSLQPLMILVQAIMPHPEIVKAIDNVVDEMGEIKDSASAELRKARQQVQSAEERLKELLGGFSDRGGKVVVQNDRMCLAINSAFRETVPGLLIGSGGDGSLFVEPPAAVALNNKLAEARRAATAAEDAVRKAITERLTPWLDDITAAMGILVKVDVIAARARCARWLKAAKPTFVKIVEEKKEVVREKVKRPEENKYASLADKTPEEETVSEDEEAAVSTAGWGVTESDTGSSDDESASDEDESPEGDPPKKRIFSESPEFLVRLEKARHPLLVLQHQDALKKAKQKVKSRAAALKRAKQRGMFGVGRAVSLESLEASLRSAEQEESELAASPPIPIDVLIRSETRVVAITGPNTGGKTAAIKTLGLAALMAKAGLFVPASEPVLLPWFDSVLCDIGDDQSLVQSLSTFSGHLRRIKRIKAESTARSLVLLDEVGGGTDPTEGAALGMALLQSFAEQRPGGSLLTLATTHHGELKTLKYSDPRFENACVEFDEARLAPTFRLLWGIPGRSNALNIAERLGLDGRIISEARNLHGEANLEASEAILDLERQRKAYAEAVDESERLLKEARRMQRQLLAVDRRLKQHQGPLLLKQATEVEAAAQQAREQVTHLQNVLRGHVAARERRRREERERRALDEAMRLEEERMREERMREAAMSGNVFGALAGLKVGTEDGGVRRRDEGGRAENGRAEREEKKERKGVGASAEEGRATSGAKAGPSGNPFGALRDKLEEKKSREGMGQAKPGSELEGLEARKYGEAESSDDEELDRYVEELVSAYKDDGDVTGGEGRPFGLGLGGNSAGQPASLATAQVIRTGRGVKRLGARMKKRPNEVVVPPAASLKRQPETPSIEEKGAPPATDSVGVESGMEEKSKTSGANGNSTNGFVEERQPAPAPKESSKATARKEKGLSGWKGQLAQLKDLQRR